MFYQEGPGLWPPVVWPPSLLQKQEGLFTHLCRSVKSPHPTEQTTLAPHAPTAPSPATSLPARTLSLTKYPVLQCIPFRSRPTPMISPHFHRSHTGGVNTEHSLPHPASFWGVKLAPLSPTPSPPSSPGSASSTPRKRCLTAQLLLCSHFSSGLCIIILSQNKPLALRGLNPCSTQTVPKPGPRSPSLPTSSPLGISEGFDCACIPPHPQIHPGTE